MDASTVVCGEVGLVGEVRGVASLQRRLTDAARLGFTRAIVPQSGSDGLRIKGMELLPVADLQAALECVFPAHPAIAVAGNRPRPTMSIVS